MLPMSLSCQTCGNYMGEGTKFNTRKEVVDGEAYLGTIQVFRFYFECTQCSAEFTLKTDPQNSDYIVESGATRNFEPGRAEEEAADTVKQKRVAEEMGDALKSLENRTMDSKREVDIVATLHEMKSLKSRHASVSADSMLEALKRTAEETEKKLEEEDEDLIRSIAFKKPEDFVCRIDDQELEDDDDDEAGLKRRKISEFTEASKSRSKGDSKFVFKSSSVHILCSQETSNERYGSDNEDSNE